MPKRRGAPIGNTNALKHGFYAESQTGIENGDVDIVRDQMKLIEFFIDSIKTLAPELDTRHDRSGNYRFWVLAVGVFNELMRLQQAACGSTPRKSLIRSAILEAFTKAFKDTASPGWTPTHSPKDPAAKS